MADIFVDAAATGAADGSSWADAFTTYAAANAAASASDSIHFAPGVYTEQLQTPGASGLSILGDPQEVKQDGTAATHGRGKGLVIIRAATSAVDVHNWSGANAAGSTFKRLVVAQTEVTTSNPHRNCLIIGDTSNYVANVTVEDCVFIGNSVGVGGYTDGGWVMRRCLSMGGLNFWSKSNNSGAFPGSPDIKYVGCHAFVCGESAYGTSFPAAGFWMDTGASNYGYVDLKQCMVYCMGGYLSDPQTFAAANGSSTYGKMDVDRCGFAGQWTNHAILYNITAGTVAENNIETLRAPIGGPPTGWTSRLLTTSTNMAGLPLWIPLKDGVFNDVLGTATGYTGEDLYDLFGLAWGATPGAIEYDATTMQGLDYMTPNSARGVTQIPSAGGSSGGGGGGNSQIIRGID